MPVQKFRTLDEAARALWTTSDDPQLLARARGLMAFVGRVVTIRIPTGVRRFRSIEESLADRQGWVIETRFKRAGAPPRAD